MAKGMRLLFIIMIISMAIAFLWNQVPAIKQTAHLILDPSISLELKPGEVLVAPYTDPAWTPLFLTAGAAVVEVGSYLSHAGTVAREFGMPCVVDLQDCTRLIHSGVIVRVQGDRGLVRIISRQGGQKA